MDGALLEKKACEILIAPQCDSSDNEQGGFNTPKKPFRKRKREALTDVAKGSYTPPRQMGWGMGFSSAKASESESEISEPCGAVYFIKGYESAVTAVVTDSEDDLFFLDETVEFEPPGSDSDEDENDNEEESDDEAVVISSEDEDPGAEGGDEYEEGQDLDSDIDEDDLWACPQCNLKNHPMSRQCARCWIERHEWLPHLKRLSSEPGMDLSTVTGKTTIVPPLQKSASLAVAPTIENPSSSTVTLTSQAISHGFTSERNLQEQSHSSEHVASLNNIKQTAVKSLETKDCDGAFSPDLCVICLMQPRNASLVHGRTGHQVCCIGCAEKLKDNKKKCPVCRKKIKLVVKNFF